MVAVLILVAAAGAADKKTAANPPSPRFEISFPKQMSATPLDGHILLLISNNNEKETRFQVSFMTAQSLQVFGVEVDSLAPGSPTVVDGPLSAIREMSERSARGRLLVQAVLNIYETFHLENGRTLKLPPDKGEGQHCR